MNKEKHQVYLEAFEQFVQLTITFGRCFSVDVNEVDVRLTAQIEVLTTIGENTSEELAYSVYEAMYYTTVERDKNQNEDDVLTVLGDFKAGEDILQRRAKP